MSAEVTDADRATALQLAIDMPGVGVDGGDGWDEHVAFIAQALADQRAAADDGLRDLAEWLISLDDDDPSSPGRIHRRTVNLTEIIGRARAALDPPASTHCTARHDVHEDGVTATWSCQQLGAHEGHQDSQGRRW